MSAEPALLPVVPQQPVPVRERMLRPLERPVRRRRPKLAYALLALAGAGIIGIAQVGLSLATTVDSFVVAELTAQQRELTLQTQALEDQLAGLSSPQMLAANADALGMVVAGAPAYLRLSDATIVGASSSAAWSSTINPNARGGVSNALVSDTPLVTAPNATIDGVQTSEVVDSSAGAVSLPPAIENGLPSPKTR